MKAKASAKGRERWNPKVILVPSDLSSASARAIPWAKYLAGASRAAIHLVHVTGYEYPLPAEVVPPDIVSPEEIGDQLRGYLRAFAKRFGLRVSPERIHVRTGNAADQICRLARELRADLIVSSTHGHTGWKRILLGNTAEEIVRSAPCPVFVARSDEGKSRRALSLGEILVPVDFSPASRKALAFAIAFARRCGASLRLLHVVSPDRYLTPQGAVLYAGPDLLQEALETERAEMRELVATTDFGGVPVKTTVRAGVAAEEVCAQAQKHGAGLIITATHGRTGLSHVLLGSVAERIVRYAAGPVLVVPTRRRAR